MTEVYRLKLTQVEQVCLFELTWDKGRQLTATLPYPSQIEALYQAWQRVYLRYYQSLKDQSLKDQTELRGRAVTSGQMTSKTDWHSQLVQAEARLMSEFHRWLRSGELFEIRKTLGQRPTPALSEDSALQQGFDSRKQPLHGTDILITCDSTSMSRLPWEAWEISAEFSTAYPIRIARLPTNVRAVATPDKPRARARVLVILGDDTGLNFESDLAAMTALKHLVDIKIIGWQPGTDADSLKQDICDKIQSPLGWDMLLFFGHSNEANMVGGQISIAPNTSVSMQELEPYLKQAKKNGLKFALFNSCQGLDIAKSLINLGLNQVVVMREPIHNRVAQLFLVQFLQSLSQFDDVHTALQKASQSLGSESNLTYPSAHLVPSLFRHSDAVLFRLRPIGWRVKLRSLLPKRRWQTVALSAIAGLSLFSPMSQRLLSQRLWTQSVYRQVTEQLPVEKDPPVLLVEIDEDSVIQDLIGIPRPIDRSYLARIIDELSAHNAQIVGVDYLLDQGSENDDRFAQSISTAVDKGMWIVFGAILKNQKEAGVRDNLADLNWVMQGAVHTPFGYLRVPTDEKEETCEERCPFNYLLAMLAVAQETSLTSDIPLTLDRKQDLRDTLIRTIKKTNRKPSLQALYDLRLSLWTALSRLWKQRWLHPIIDFSIPPEYAYTRVSAHTLFSESENKLQTQFDGSRQVALITSGGYADAGVDSNQKDYVPLPPAISYWNKQDNPPPTSEVFPLGGANAYAIHHFLKQHYVIPIPDFWLVGLGVISGAGLALLLSLWRFSRWQRSLTLSALSLLYGLISLQLYISELVLLPWLLPVSIIWIYCLPTRKLPAQNFLSLKLSHGKLHL